MVVYSAFKRWETQRKELNTDRRLINYIFISLKEKFMTKDV